MKKLDCDKLSLFCFIYKSFCIEQYSKQKVSHENLGWKQFIT